MFIQNFLNLNSSPKHVVSLRKTKAAVRLKYSQVLKLGRINKTSSALPTAILTGYNANWLITVLYSSSQGTTSKSPLPLNCAVMADKDHGLGPISGSCWEVHTKLNNLVADSSILRLLLLYISSEEDRKPFLKLQMAPYDPKDTT